MIGNEQFQDFFLMLMKLEGGFSNDKDDSGGATNYGITQGLLDKLDYINVHDVRDLTMKEAEEIYFKEFYTPVRNLVNKSRARLNGKQTYHIFDTAVNSGFGAARKLLSNFENGGRTLQELREHLYREIVKKDAKQSKFLTGWLNRLNRIEEEFIC